MELMEFWPIDGSTMFHCTQVAGSNIWECAPRTVRMLGLNVKSCLDSNILAHPHLFPLGNPPLGYLVLQTSQLIKPPMVHRPIERPFTKAPRLGQIENPHLWSNATLAQSQLLISLPHSLTDHFHTFLHLSKTLCCRFVLAA